MTWDDGTPYVDELAPGMFAYVQPDGGWMVNNCGVVVDGSGDRRPGRHHLDREAQPRAAGRGGQGEQRRARGGREHPPPSRPHLRQRVPARRDAGHRPREVPRRGAARRPRGDQGDHRARLRRPHAAAAGADLPRPADPAPGRPRRRAAPRRPAGAHDQRRHRLAARAAGALLRRPGLQRWPAVRAGGLGRRLPPGDRADEGARPRGARPGHGPVCRGEDVGRLLDDSTPTSIRRQVAAESHAAGLTALRPRRSTRVNPYTDWAETERFVGNLHRAYTEIEHGHGGRPADRPGVWPDMVAFHGGPIACHA